MSSRLNNEPVARPEGQNSDGTAIREHLITAVVPFGDAPELFADLAAGRRHELQAVLAVMDP
jgi:hypothetical protein